MSRLEHLCLIQSCFVEVETNKLRSEDIEALEVYALNSTILYFQVKHLLHFNSCRLMHFNIGFGFDQYPRGNLIRICFWASLGRHLCNFLFRFIPVLQPSRTIQTSRCCANVPGVSNIQLKAKQILTLNQTVTKWFTDVGSCCLQDFDWSNFTLLIVLQNTAQNFAEMRVTHVSWLFCFIWKILMLLCDVFLIVICLSAITKRAKENYHML